VKEEEEEEKRRRRRKKKKKEQEGKRRRRGEEEEEKRTGEDLGLDDIGDESLTSEGSWLHLLSDGHSRPPFSYLLLLLPLLLFHFV